MRKRMGLKLLAVAWLAAPGGAAFAQDLSVAPNWENPADALPRPTQVAIGLPRQAAGLRLTELADFNNSGGIDNIAQYRSADGAVFATVYIYRTTLADPAIASIATDTIVRARFGAGTEPIEDTIIAAGGHDGVARRILYESPEGATLAAFTGMGPWTVKLRVSGPAAARGQVEAGADAILDGLEFGEGLIPQPFRPYEFTACPVDSGGAEARRIQPSGDQALASTMAATLMVAALIRDRSIVIPEGTSGTQLCAMASRATGPGHFVTALRRTDHDAEMDFMLVGDAGRAFEVLPPMDAALPGHHLVFHSVGPALVFGPFDRTPSVDQLFAMLTGGDAAWLGQPVATASVDAEGNPQIGLPPAGPQQAQ